MTYYTVQKVGVLGKQVLPGSTYWHCHIMAVIPVVEIMDGVTQLFR